MKTVTALLLFIISIISAGIFIIALTTDFSQRTKISVYYESLCPYSIAFVTEEFYPNYKNLKGYIEMDWIPYGWANQSFKNNEWLFTCQHGNEECMANKYQACAISQKRSQDEEVEFINCVLSSDDPFRNSSIKKCANVHGFNWDDIVTCFHNGEGDKVLAQLGERTQELNSRILVVPIIIFNDHYDQRLNTYAKNNFLKAMCSQIPHPRPDIC